MTGKDSIDVTLAHVDPSLVSCWDKMVKQGEECSLHLKHSKGKVIATLQCTRTVKPPTLSLSPSPSAKEKKKKRKGGKKKKLEKLLAYHQRLVEEKGLPPSRLMEEHAASSPAPSTQVTSEKRFKCDQCDFASDSQRGLKVHVGRSHKETEVLRAEEHDVSFALSEMSETREEPAIQQEAVVSDPSPPVVPEHKCPSYLCSKFRCPKETEKQKRHWQEMKEFLDRQGYDTSSYSRSEDS